jgi:hypothetical protein
MNSSKANHTLHGSLRYDFSFDWILLNERRFCLNELKINWFLCHEDVWGRMLRRRVVSFTPRLLNPHGTQCTGEDSLTGTPRPFRS